MKIHGEETWFRIDKDRLITGKNSIAFHFTLSSETDLERALLKQFRTISATLNKGNGLIEIWLYSDFCEYVPAIMLSAIEITKNPGKFTDEFASGIMNELSWIAEVELRKGGISSQNRNGEESKRYIKSMIEKARKSLEGRHAERGYPDEKVVAYREEEGGCEGSHE